MSRMPRWGWGVVIGAVVLAGGGIGVTAAVAAGREAPSTAATHRASATRSPSASASPSGGGYNAAAGVQDPTANESPTTRASATPVSVDIPSIGVQSSLVGLHKDDTGALIPPTDWNQVGWFQDGVVPGHTGPAVLAGHVDSLTSAAIFYDLDELAPGDQVQVAMSDGTTLTFTVTGSEQAPKNAFPTKDVYGSTPTPELRLITCGGSFDRTAGHYTDNLIVFADLSGS